ncbi:whey acidic protein-like isoform X2 [Pimephales promelas]|uniref:whey acidic protein-like isoform X2 n=1 Tax=Pimephales promelas TaxID=90988 RepID=UPI001955CA97|nr:whey acidic protein-like isoform X2 [Pimephales promelas]
MTYRVYYSLLALLLCTCVCWSVRNVDDRYRAKPGVCPSTDGYDVCGGEICFRDDDCLGDEKCCENECGRRCTTPYLGEPKPGVCPSDVISVRVAGVCVESCSHDIQCPNDEKCCSNGCGLQCTAPYKDEPKPGVCPKVPPGTVGLCAEWCSSDSQCPNDEKCCSNGCGHMCSAPFKDEPKPGVCPKLPPGTVGICVESCSSDSDCPNDEKCCSNGCGHTCSAPFKDEPKPGVCPRKFIGLGECNKPCSSDSDCPDEDKCCRTRCGRQCVTPSRCLGPHSPFCREVEP